jgi:hypothetical protein
MAVVDSREMYRGRGRQTTYGDVPVYTRIFLVRVDDPNTDIQDISAEPGINWLDAHPENENALLIDSNVQQDGDSPFHYRLTFTYKSAEDLLEDPVDRPAQFSFSGGLASAPAFWYFPNNNDNSTKRVIINTAGDPIGGLDRDEGEFTVSITINKAPPFDYAKAQSYVGAINSDTWSGGAAKTWKCMSITGNRKIEDVAGTKYLYWETNATLAYRNTGWDLQTWDVGFNEIKNGARKKIMAGSEPVSEPAALSNGVAKAPGQPPDLLTLRIYPMLAFTGTFPSLPS